MVGHIESLKTAIHGVAYNYHWRLDYIKSSFNLEEISRLLDDAVLFNPWISKKKEQAEEIPEADYVKRREEFDKRRKEWLERGISNV